MIVNKRLVEGLIVTLLLLMSYNDIKTLEIPIRYNLVLLTFVLIYKANFKWTRFYVLDSLLSAIIFGTVYLIGALYFNGGGADFLTATFIAFGFGLYSSSIIFIIANVLCIVYSLRFTKNKRNKDIPYMPFIAIGFIIERMVSILWV